MGSCGWTGCGDLSGKWFASGFPCVNEVPLWVNVSDPDAATLVPREVLCIRAKRLKTCIDMGGFSIYCERYYCR